MLKEALRKVVLKADLTPQEMESVFGEMVSGGAEKEDVKAFLTALAAKGESPDEIFAAARVMREKAVKVTARSKDAIDTCGTGGAPFNDANTSTISAILVSACGVKVAKHGNRSFTGRCGSADLLEALGVNIENKPEEAAWLIDNAGFGFIFARNYHPAMKNVMEARKELKIRTIFNLLGPISNPAGVKRQVMGVYIPELTDVMAEALYKLGSEAVYVVHGMEGLDEIAIKGRTRITELKGGRLRTFYVSPSDFGFREGDLEKVRGGAVEYNRDIALRVLSGGYQGPERDMVLMNTAAALVLAEKAGGFMEGVTIAAKRLVSGAALAKLKELQKLSNRPFGD